MELYRKALDMTKADIYRFIAKQTLGVLGTLSSGGSPQSALVGIAVTPELEIIFDTVKSSRKSRAQCDSCDSEITSDGCSVCRVRASTLPASAQPRRVYLPPSGAGTRQGLWLLRQ